MTRAREKDEVLVIKKFADLREFFTGFKVAKTKRSLIFHYYPCRHTHLVMTPFGGVRAEKGDYIVVVPDGTMYVFKPKLFKLMFEDIPCNQNVMDVIVGDLDPDPCSQLLR